MCLAKLFNSSLVKIDADIIRVSYGFQCFYYRRAETCNSIHGTVMNGITGFLLILLFYPTFLLKVYCY